MVLVLQVGEVAGIGRSSEALLDDGQEVGKHTDWRERGCARGTASGGEDEGGLDDSETDATIEEFAGQSAIRPGADSESARSRCVQSEQLVYETAAAPEDGIRRERGPRIWRHGTWFG